MKVLHVIPSVGPRRGGPSVAAGAMCRALAELGVEVRMACTNDDGAGVLDVPTGEWVPHEGVTTWFFQRREACGRALREFQIGRGFGSWFSAEVGRWDVVHVHALFSYLPSSAMRIARRRGVPYVVRPLGVLEAYSLRRSAWKKRLFLRLFDGANLRGAAAVHLTSRREQEVSLIPGSAPRWVIPLGVDIPPAASAGQSSGSFRIVFLSRWHEKKRIGVLLEALGMVRELDWRLDLAGTGDDRLVAEVHRTVAALGLGERVSLPGFVSGDAKARLLDGADLFVLPSASENFGIAVAEAMAHGLPCVVTRHVALSEEIAEAGAGWVCGDSAAGLADVLRAAIPDRAECRRRGGLARRLAINSFSWASCGEALFAGYRRILSAGRTRRSA